MKQVLHALLSTPTMDLPLNIPGASWSLGSAGYSDDHLPMLRRAVYSLRATSGTGSSSSIRPQGERFFVLACSPAGGRSLLQHTLIYLNKFDSFYHRGQPANACALVCIFLKSGLL
jgi:hypothetical protein